MIAEARLKGRMLIAASGPERNFHANASPQQRPAWLLRLVCVLRFTIVEPIGGVEMVR